MKDFVHLHLTRNDVGQIIDGLHERLLTWRGTYEYLRHGHTELVEIIEQCSDPDEARAIADDYQAIIDTLETQLKAQDTKATDSLESKLAEYTPTTQKCRQGGAVDWNKLTELLIQNHDWTPIGAATLTTLVRHYGRFILANANALAKATNTEDGDSGL